MRLELQQRGAAGAAAGAAAPSASAVAFAGAFPAQSIAGGAVTVALGPVVAEVQAATGHDAAPGVLISLWLEAFRLPADGLLWGRERAAGLLMGWLQGGTLLDVALWAAVHGVRSLGSARLGWTLSAGATAIKGGRAGDSG